MNEIKYRWTEAVRNNVGKVALCQLLVEAKDEPDLKKLSKLVQIRLRNYAVCGLGKKIIGRKDLLMKYGDTHKVGTFGSPSCHPIDGVSERFD